MSDRIIFLNNFSNVMKLISYLAISFFMTPFLVQNLGPTFYGIWAMVLSVVGYMTLMDLGMQSAVMKHVAECDGQKDKETLSQVIVSSLAFYGFLAIVGGIILAILVWGGLPLLKINPDHFSTVRWVLLIMGIDMLLVFPGTVFQGVLAGMQLFYVTNSISIFFLFIKAGAIYLAVSYGEGLLAMALITLLGNLFEYFLFFSFVHWRYHLVLFRSDNFSIKKLKQLISFGIKSFMVMISGRTTLSSDSLIVGYFLSPAWVPFYIIPASLVNYSRNLLWALTQSFLPLFSKLGAQNDLKKMQSIYLRYTRYICICFFPLLVFLITFGEPFLRIWMGTQFAERGEYVIYLLTSSLFVSAIQPLSGRFLTGTSRQGIQIWTGFISATIFVGGGIILIKTHGLTGLATAFLIGTLIPGYFLIRYPLSVINLSLRNYFMNALASPLLTALITGTVLLFIRKMYYPITYGNLLLQCVIGILLYSTLAYLIALTSYERTFIGGVLISLRRKRILFYQRPRCPS